MSGKDRFLEGSDGHDIRGLRPGEKLVDPVDALLAAAAKALADEELRIAELQLTDPAAAQRMIDDRQAARDANAAAEEQNRIAAASNT